MKSEIKESFYEAFELIFEAYSRPADTFSDDTEWAMFMHTKICKAYSFIQKLRENFDNVIGSIEVQKDRSMTPDIDDLIERLRDLLMGCRSRAHSNCDLGIEHELSD